MAASSNDVYNSLGSRSNTIGTESGYIVEPQGEHRATIVWLHDLNENSSNSLQFVRSLHLGNIKWICPDSGTRFVRCTHGVGVSTTAWFNIGSTQNMQDDLDELDSAAVRVANILSTEPENVIKGVGGVGLGAQVALHFATWTALGNHSINMRVVIGINGWLYTWKSIKSRIDSTAGAATRAASQSILLIRGTSDSRIPFFFTNKSVDSLIDAGFGEVSFVPFPMLGREIIVNVMNEVKAWLKEKLPLDPNESLP